MSQHHVTCVVVDDHPMVRAAMVNILEREPWIRIVGEADTGRSGLMLLRMSRPDIAIVDVRMPDIDGVELCAAATAEELPTAIVLHSAFTSSALRETARGAGAVACIDKGRSPGDLIEVMRGLATQAQPGISSEA